MKSLIIRFKNDAEFDIVKGQILKAVKEKDIPDESFTFISSSDTEVIIEAENFEF